MKKFYFKKKDSKKCRKETDEYIKKNFMSKNCKDIFGTIEYLIEYNINRLFEDEDFVDCIKSIVEDNVQDNGLSSIDGIIIKDNIDMVDFKKAYDGYEDYKTKFYDDLDSFMINPYKGIFEIWDSNLYEDDEDLAICIIPDDDKEWFDRYHNDFCEKFKVKFVKAHNGNNKIHYEYRVDYS